MPVHFAGRAGTISGDVFSVPTHTIMGITITLHRTSVLLIFKNESLILSENRIQFVWLSRLQIEIPYIFLSFYALYKTPWGVHSHHGKQKSITKARKNQRIQYNKGFQFSPSNTTN